MIFYGFSTARITVATLVTVWQASMVALEDTGTLASTIFFPMTSSGLKMEHHCMFIGFIVYILIYILNIS